MTRSNTSNARYISKLVKDTSVVWNYMNFQPSDSLLSPKRSRPPWNRDLPTIPLTSWRLMIWRPRFLLVDVGGMWMQNDQPHMERLGKNQKTAWFIGSNSQIWFLGHGLVALTPKNCPCVRSRHDQGGSLDQHCMIWVWWCLAHCFFWKKQLVMLIIAYFR